MVAKTWLMLSVGLLLSAAMAIGAVSHAVRVRQSQSDQARYFWDRGRCYRVHIEKGGSLTRAQQDSPEGLCPPIDWSHRQLGMQWRAVVDCQYDACAPGSILGRAPRRVTSYVGAGPTREEACQTAELYLRSAIGKVHCQATACSCQKADFDAARP